VDVPPGTVVRTLEGQLVGELTEPDQVSTCLLFVVDGILVVVYHSHGGGDVCMEWQQLMVARGGRGGRGNEAFKTDRNSAPKMNERGEAGGERWLQVELKLVRGM